MKKAYFDDFDLVVFDDVYEPDDDSFLIAKHVNPFPKSNILDMGCGSGIISIVAASKEANVLSADINESALKNLELNATRLGLNSRIKTVKSDLFENVKGTFDYIYFNPPYVPADENDEQLRKNEPKLSKAWDGGKEGRETIKRFIDNVGKHMDKKTKVFMIASSKNDFEWFRTYLEFKGFSWEIIDEKALFFEVLSLFVFHKA